MRVTVQQVMAAYARWQNEKGTIEGTLAMVEFHRLNRQLAKQMESFYV